MAIYVPPKSRPLAWDGKKPLRLGKLGDVYLYEREDDLYEWQFFPYHGFGGHISRPYRKRETACEGAVEWVTKQLVKVYRQLLGLPLR